MKQRLAILFFIMQLWGVLFFWPPLVHASTFGGLRHGFSRPTHRLVLAATTCPQATAPSGSVVTAVQIPVSGTYVVWSRMMTHGPVANAYWLQIDADCPIIVGDAALPLDSFTWVNYRDGVSSAIIYVQLSAGMHTVSLLGKESGVGVDSLLFTTDTHCTPQAVPSCVGPTVTISPSIPGGTTQIAVTIGLHGIGTGGDNANPTSTGTSSPLHPARSVVVTIFNSQNVEVAQVLGQIVFGSDTGKFAGTLTLPQSISSGVYTMRVRVDGFLQKVVPGIISISSGQRVVLPSMNLTSGDTNADNFLSVLDYNLILDCYSDLSAARNCSNLAKQQAADITDDGRVNEFDYNLFLRELSTQGGQ